MLFPFLKYYRFYNSVSASLFTTRNERRSFFTFGMSLSTSNEKELLNYSLDNRDLNRWSCRNSCYWSSRNNKLHWIN